LSATVPSEELLFREGNRRDLRSVFELQQLALSEVRGRTAPVPDSSPAATDLDALWERGRSFSEFIAAQEGCFFICERPEGIVGYARTVRFEGMEQLAELFVHPDHQGRGIGKGLLQRCWPEPPDSDHDRVVVATGAPADLTLYTGCGMMPVNGRLGLVGRTERYVERRLRERDATEPDVHALEPDRAVGEWRRMEPEVIGHERGPLHMYLARERTCLASIGKDGEVNALCWVSQDGRLGPGAAGRAEDLVPVVLAALDRVAKTHEPEELQMPAIGSSWWLLQRMRTLGFKISWPGWVLCSIPLPELARYLPCDPGLFL
jgi:GNAT superfamily N-acetyltransferase